MYNPFTFALAWAPFFTSLLLPLLSSIPTTSAFSLEFIIQPYFIFEFWVIETFEVAEFVLVLEQKPCNGRGTHFVQGLQNGQGRKDSQGSSSTGAASSLNAIASSSSAVGGGSTNTALTTTSSLVSSVASSSGVASVAPSSPASNSSAILSSPLSLASSLASGSSVSADSLSSQLSVTSASSSPSSLPTPTPVEKKPVLPVPSGVFGNTPVNTTNKGMSRPFLHKAAGPDLSHLIHRPKFFIDIC